VVSVDWKSDDTFDIAGVEYICDQYGVRLASERSRFCLAKVPAAVDRYASFLLERAPRTIVEVGILEGASTAMLAQLAAPTKLVAIEWADAPGEKLRQFIATHRLDEVVAVYGGVDQSDTRRLDEIMAAEFDGPIDLVVDDASHLLEPSRATFNCLFPRLRTGGIYLLEDWPAGLRVGGPMPLKEGERPLMDLLSDVISLKGRCPRVVGDVTVKAGWTEIERGSLSIDLPFDVQNYGHGS
jgi:hypothetical protein